MILTVEEIDNNLRHIIERARDEYPPIIPVFEIMYYKGVRAQEATNLERWYFINPYTVILSPLKYNDKRTFDKDELPTSFLDYLKSYPQIPYFFNYDRTNYLFNQFSLYSQIYIGDKKSTLYLFRHNFVKKLVAEGKTDTQIQQILGERQLRSAQTYINSVFSTEPII